LADLLKGKVGEIQINETPGFNLELVRNGSRFRLDGIDPAQFPPLPAKPESGVEVEAGPLSNMLGKVLHAASGDDLQYNLATVLIEAIKPAALRMAATDGHRLAMVQAQGQEVFFLSLFKEGVLIPRRGAYELVRFLKGCDKVRLSIENTRLVIVDGDRLLAMRLVDKKFPDYRRILPGAPVHRFTFSREELAEAVKSVAKLSTDRFKGVVFRFSK